MEKNTCLGRHLGGTEEGEMFPHSSILTDVRLLLIDNLLV